MKRFFYLLLITSFVFIFSSCGPVNLKDYSGASVYHRSEYPHGNQCYLYLRLKDSTTVKVEVTESDYYFYYPGSKIP